MGWQEVDLANPQSHYARAKYAADLAIQDLPNTTILRLRMPISPINHPRNLINKLQNYNQILNVSNSVSFLDDIVRCIDWVIQKELTGIYNCTNPGVLAATDIMQEFQKYAPKHQFKTISEKELNEFVVAKRSNCILDCNKLFNTGFLMELANIKLKSCMEEYIKTLI